MRIAHLPFVASLVLCSLTANAADATQPKVFAQPPRIEPNPNPNAPLAAVLRLKTSVPAAVKVEVTDGKKQWSIEFPSADERERALPIVGMRPGRLHRLTVAVSPRDGKGTTWPRALEFRTPPLPVLEFEFPKIVVAKSEPARMEPGITLMTVRRRSFGRPHMLTPIQRDFSTRWGMIVAIDADGEVVWYYKADRRIAGVAPLKNGNLFYHSHGSVPTEIDLLGNKVREWGAALGPEKLPVGAIPVQATTLHHQPDQLPNGNFLSLMAEPRIIENYYTDEHDANAPRKTTSVMGDDIIEFTPEGKVVWQWSAFDHLDPFRIGYELYSSYWWVRGFPGVADWTHGNGVKYDPRDDSVIVSFRLQEAILKIDRKTKQIKWILAPDKRWSPELRSKLLRPIGDDFQWPHHQHNPRVTNAGTVIVFNNNVFQAIPFTGDPIAPPEKSLSNALEYQVDEKAMTVKLVFATPPSPPEEACSTFAMGDAHRLPKTSNVLVCYSLCFPKMTIETFDMMDRSKTHTDDLPSTPKIQEFTHGARPELVFEVQVIPPHQVMQWEVYGVYRIPSLHLQPRGQH